MQFFDYNVPINQVERI